MTSEFSSISDITAAMKSLEESRRTADSEVKMAEAKLRKWIDDELSAIDRTYDELRRFFSDNWDRLQGDRLRGGIWRNDYVVGSPWTFNNVYMTRDRDTGKVLSFTLSSYAEDHRKIHSYDDWTNYRDRDKIHIEKKKVEHRRAYLEAVLAQVRDGLAELIANEKYRQDTILKDCGEASLPHREIDIHLRIQV